MSVSGAQSHETDDALRAYIDTLASNPRESQSVEALDPERQEYIHDRKSDRQLKRTYAFRFIWILIGQLVVMNIVFILHGLGLLVFSDYILHLYMGGTLLEIFGIVLVITRSLFPNGEAGERRATTSAPKHS